MKKVYVGICVSVMLAATTMWLVPIQAKVTAGDITGGKKAPHVNIAIFHKLYGHDDFVYPEAIATTDILQATAGQAQFIAISHTSGLKDGDVITMNNDVLREGDKNFEDFGVDCELAFHVKGNAVTLAGMCQILMIDQDYREIDHKGIVKEHHIDDTQKGWHLIYNDVEDGIAVYADAEVERE